MGKEQSIAVRLAWLDRPLAICRLPASSSVPEWAMRPGAFFCAVRAADELSLVCEVALLPGGDEIVGRDGEGPFLAFRVADPLDFSLVGVLASLLVPMAAAGVSVFVVSTHDTDYVLVREGQRGAATAALTGAGHEFV
jgi:uncharacterized protein